MKKFLAAGLLLASMNVFSQSYLILNNGVTLTTDNAGFLYDFGHFHLPYKINVTGGQFFIEDNKLSTVDSSGFLYEKGKKIEKVKAKGSNFLITDDNKLVTFDAKGFFYEFDKDDKIFRKVTLFGGNFFLVKPDDKKPQVDLYTVNDKGNYFRISLNGLNPADIIAVGGTYFQTKSGVVYTVSKDGFVFSKADQKVGTISKIGGNFFIDSAGLLFTVSDEGFLMLPILPANIKVVELTRLGANFMLDASGKIFTVDKTGAMSERIINHDLRQARILGK